jgi:hypothetical protein
MKYITVNKGSHEFAVLFSAPVTHRDMYLWLQPCELIGAGFCDIEPNKGPDEFDNPFKPNIYGKSESLNASPAPIDGILLKLAVNFRPC